MTRLALLARLITSNLLGSLVVFGSVLATFWAIGPELTSFKLASAISAGILGVGAGGLVVAWTSHRNEVALAGVFGFLSGITSFSYLLGPGGPALIVAGALAAIVAMAALGYRLAFREREPVV